VIPRPFPALAASDLPHPYSSTILYSEGIITVSFARPSALLIAKASATDSVATARLTLNKLQLGQGNM